MSKTDKTEHDGKWVGAYLERSAEAPIDMLHVTSLGTFDAQGRIPLGRLHPPCGAVEPNGARCVGKAEPWDSYVGKLRIARAERGCDRVYCRASGLEEQVLAVSAGSPAFVDRVLLAKAITEHLSCIGHTTVHIVMSEDSKE